MTTPELRRCRWTLWLAALIPAALLPAIIFICMAAAFWRITPTREGTGGAPLPALTAALFDLVQPAWSDAAWDLFLSSTFALAYLIVFWLVLRAGSPASAILRFVVWAVSVLCLELLIVVLVAFALILPFCYHIGTLN